MYIEKRRRPVGTYEKSNFWYLCSHQLQGILTQNMNGCEIYVEHDITLAWNYINVSSQQCARSMKKHESCVVRRVSG